MLHVKVSRGQIKVLSGRFYGGREKMRRKPNKDSKKRREPRDSSDAKSLSFRASHFETKREQHNLEAAEDYTELVYELEQRIGEARTGTIAEHLGISHVTALRTIKRLQALGYLKTARQKPVELTAKGRKLAIASKARHEMLVDFFVSLGVPREIAEHDVEGAEHHFSKVTLRRIRQELERRTD
jgi:DtxR family manganese transport transcriptional regulator